MTTPQSRVEMDLRNLRAFRILEYLTEAGGTPVSDRAVTAPNWRAELIEMEPVRFRVMEVPRDLLVIQGDSAEVERVHSFMRTKTMRGGG